MKSAIERLYARRVAKLDAVASLRAKAARSVRAPATGETRNRRNELCYDVAVAALEGEYAEAAARRLVILREIGDDKAKQAEEAERCARDVRYFVRRWCWSYDPRLPGPKVTPLEPFPAQEELLTWLDELELAQEPGMIEKSRDMGATWLLMCWYVHRWLNVERWAGSVGSRKLEMADKKGDLSSVLEKARFIVEHLPSWLKPVGYDPMRDAPKARLKNPQNGAQVTAEGGKHIGRGGRQGTAAVDEMAFLDDPESAETALSQTAGMIVYLSTPGKPWDWFHSRRNSGNWRVFRLHWLSDPKKARWRIVGALGVVLATGVGAATPPVPPGAHLEYPWYERQKIRYPDPAMMAREIDIDYEGSAEDAVFPAAWVAAAVDYELATSGFRLAGYDPAGSGRNEAVLALVRGPVVSVVRPMLDKSSSGRAGKVLQACKEYGAMRLMYDAGGGYGDTTTDAYRGARWPFKAEAYNGGMNPSKAVIGGDVVDEEGRRLPGLRADVMFLNRRAEDHWTLRMRFERTYLRRLLESGDPDGRYYPDDECISIPNDPVLTRQLASIRWTTTTTNKIRVESKEEMRDRKVASPDRADAVVLAYARKRIADNETPVSTSTGGAR